MTDKFRVHKTKAVAGNPLWEVRRVRDNQCMTEPFMTEAECADWLANNAAALEAEFGA